MSHQNPDYVLILEDQATNSSYTLHVSRDVYDKATKDLSFATKLLESHKASIAEQASNAVQTNMVPQASNACDVNNLIPLQLFEEQTGQLHCLLLSPEDHQHASTDAVFAEQVLRQHEKTYLIRPVEYELEIPLMLECEVPSTQEEEEESTSNGSKGQSIRCSWNSEQVLLLVSLYEKFRELYNSGKLTNRQFFKKIVEGMVEKGCTYNVNQCSDKMESLNKKYKKIYDNAKSISKFITMPKVELRSKRPFKIWDSWRNVRKGLVVSNFEELIHKGREKLGIPSSENVSLVLESDGTQVEDGEYFKTLSNNTVLLLLRHGERWYPTGVDIIRAAISAIPKIVCETIHALELHDETPSWKIMDNKGRVTVVLHWDQRSSASAQTQQPKASEGGPGSKYSPTKKVDLKATQRPSLVIQTSLDKINYSCKTPTCSEFVGSGSRFSSPQITVINHDDMVQRSFISPSNSSYAPVNQYGRLVKQGTNSFDSTTIHIHTAECSNHIHQPVIRNGSPVNSADGPGQECDFHCCALHEEGRRIAVHKSVATSPIQDPQLHGPHQPPQTPSPQPASSLSDGTRRQGLVKGHVRFRDTATEEELQTRTYTLHRTHQQHFEQHESSESETENTIIEDEVVTSEKFLLLIDQLTVDQKHHLSIKDIGIILERLSSKILDVERLDRESESDECYNWTIKAVIRGDMLRELGVIYNGNYYAISEHPGYKEESEENNDDNDDDEEEDRL